MRGAPPTGTILCTVDEIADPGAKGFTFRDGDHLFQGFVVRRGAAVLGYLDRCPHTGLPLSINVDQYMTREGDLILCSSHGALFQPADGLCIGGPCAGRSLWPWAVEVRDGTIFAI